MEIVEFGKDLDGIFLNIFKILNKLNFLKILGLFTFHLQHSLVINLLNFALFIKLSDLLKGILLHNYSQPHLMLE